MNFESQKKAPLLSWILGLGAQTAQPFTTDVVPEAEAEKAIRHEDENVMMRVLLNERINPASKQVTKDAAALIEVAASFKS